MPGIGEFVERRSEQVGAIEAIPAAQGQGAAPIGYSQEPVPIVFDLMQPVGAGGRFVGGRCDKETDFGRQFGANRRFRHLKFRHKTAKVGTTPAPAKTGVDRPFAAFR